MARNPYSLGLIITISIIVWVTTSLLFVTSLTRDNFALYDIDQSNNLNSNEIQSYFQDRYSISPTHLPTLVNDVISTQDRNNDQSLDFDEFDLSHAPQSRYITPASDSSAPQSHSVNRSQERHNIVDDENLSFPHSSRRHVYPPTSTSVSTPNIDQQPQEETLLNDDINTNTGQGVVILPKSHLTDDQVGDKKTNPVHVNTLRDIRSKHNVNRDIRYQDCLHQHCHYCHCHHRPHYYSNCRYGTRMNQDTMNITKMLDQVIENIKNSKIYFDPGPKHSRNRIDMNRNVNYNVDIDRNVGNDCNDSVGQKNDDDVDSRQYVNRNNHRHNRHVHVYSNINYSHNNQRPNLNTHTDDHDAKIRNAINRRNMHLMPGPVIPPQNSTYYSSQESQQQQEAQADQQNHHNVMNTLRVINVGVHDEEGLDENRKDYLPNDIITTLSHAPNRPQDGQRPDHDNTSRTDNDRHDEKEAKRLYAEKIHESVEKLRQLEQSQQQDKHQKQQHNHQQSTEPSINHSLHGNHHKPLNNQAIDYNHRINDQQLDTDQDNIRQQIPHNMMVYDQLPIRLNPNHNRNTNTNTNTNLQNVPSTSRPIQHLVGQVDQNIITPEHHRDHNDHPALDIIPKRGDSDYVYKYPKNHLHTIERIIDLHNSKNLNTDHIQQYHTKRQPHIHPLHPAPKSKPTVQQPQIEHLFEAEKPTLLNQHRHPVELKLFEDDSSQDDNNNHDHYHHKRNYYDLGSIWEVQLKDQQRQQEQRQKQRQGQSPQNPPENKRIKLVDPPTPKNPPDNKRIKIIDPPNPDRHSVYNLDATP